MLNALEIPLYKTVYDQFVRVRIASKFEKIEDDQQNVLTHSSKTSVIKKMFLRKEVLPSHLETI